MILLWCLLGISLAFGIARYNQSNKLFWILFTSFVIGIAGASVYNKLTNDQSETESVQVCPTQACSGSVNIVTTEPENEECAFLSPLVSKDNTPGDNRHDFIVEGPNLKKITPPPQTS